MIDMGIELKPLRKNAKNAYYKIVEMDEGGCSTKITTYETLREAVYHAMTVKNGDIFQNGKNGLLLFYSAWTKTIRFGFGAGDWDKTVILRDLWWAEVDQSSLCK